MSILSTVGAPLPVPTPWIVLPAKSEFWTSRRSRTVVEVTCTPTWLPVNLKPWMVTIAWPSHAPDTSPTYPVPITAMRTI